jgi:hypothetical protein
LIMFIRQFSVEFVPKEKLIDYFGEILEVIDEEAYRQNDFTSGVKLPSDYEAWLNSLAEKEKFIPDSMLKNFIVRDTTC